MKKSVLLLISICSLCLLNACGSGGTTTTPPPPITTHLSVTAPASATAGTAFNFKVTALDASNNQVTNYSGTVHFTSIDAQAVLPANSTLTNGTGTFSVTLKTAGGQTITATDTAKASIAGTSNSITVSGAAAAANPVPFVNQPLSPDAVAPGGPPLTLTVNGTGFVAGSVVHWNGSARSTNFISNSKLTATVLATDVSKFNTASVTVFNPAPGGGTSNVVFFETTRPTSVVALATPSDFVTGEGSASVATGDFNGDGKIDLVVANSGSNNVSVLLGNGDGTFQAAVDYNAGTAPDFVAVGDFNGDGKLDLAVANANSNTVSIFLGSGDGTFQTPLTFDVGSEPESVGVGDFNGDGKLDLAVVNTSASNGMGSVSVLLGNGDGTFQAALNYDAGVDPVSVAIGDFNGDDKLDLAVVNIGNSVSVLLSNGDGTFQPAVNYDAGPVPISAAAGDFNGDGKLDLAVANLAQGNTGSGSVIVLLGNGDGTFQPAVTYTAGSNTDSAAVEVGDFNGDGELDLVVASFGTNLSNNISLLLGNGDGTFQAAVNYGVGSNFSVVPADFNGDGRLDLAVVGPIKTAVSVQLQPGLVSGPNAFLSPESLTFATQLLGTTSAPQPMLLADYGTATLTLSSIVTASNFTETDDCDSSVAAGAGCTINVSFAPSSIGSLSGTLSVTDSAPGSPQVAPLSGSSTEVALSPSGLRFGCFPGPILQGGICFCNTSGTATLTNMGSTSLDISNITISGALFSETNNCPASLGAGQSCSIAVTWLKSQAGRFSGGTLSVFDNGGASPQTVPLSATKSCTPSTSANSVGLASEAAGCGSVGEPTQ
jgi:FG-GAP-like repeat/FG-GAP repeat